LVLEWIKHSQEVAFKVNGPLQQARNTHGPLDIVDRMTSEFGIVPYEAEFEEELEEEVRHRSNEDPLSDLTLIEEKVRFR